MPCIWTLCNRFAQGSVSCSNQENYFIPVDVNGDQALFSFRLENSSPGKLETIYSGQRRGSKSAATIGSWLKI